MASLTIQAPPGPLLLTIQDEASRAVYYLSPVDGLMRVARLAPIPAAEAVGVASVQHVSDGRMLCPICDGAPLACRLCEVDGTISDTAMTAWMANNGTVVGND